MRHLPKNKEGASPFFFNQSQATLALSKDHRTYSYVTIIQLFN
ncbi:hypothetical protein EMIT07CA2_40572 [Brevibacillus sp. IT-7CA2]